MVANAGRVVHRPVLLFSLEMGHIELTQRLLSSEALVDAHSCVSARCRSRLDQGGPRHQPPERGPIFIDDNPNLTVMDIRARARRLKRPRGPGPGGGRLPAADDRSRRAENRQVEVSEISRGLKILARELEVPVVALSQLSRGLEPRQDKRPCCRTSESRAHRAGRRRRPLHLPREQYNPDAPIDRGAMAEIIVAKHRNGRPVRCTWPSRPVRPLRQHEARVLSVRPERPAWLPGGVTSDGGVPPTEWRFLWTRGLRGRKRGSRWTA